jgi:tetratricopeptide (TPR) repeat protein
LRLRYAALSLTVVFLVAAACTPDPNGRKQSHLAKGLTHAQAGNNSEAIVQLRNALRIDPDFVPALYALGLAYRATSAHLDALRVLQRAVHLGPDRLDIRADLGRVSLDVEAWDDAFHHGEVIRIRRPADPSGDYLVGAALVGKGRAADAVEPLTRAAAARPSPEIHKSLGDAFARLKRWQDAEAAYRTALKQDPECFEALVALGDLLMTQQNNRAASDPLRHAKSLRPAHPMPRLALSALHAREGRLDDAIREIEDLPPHTRPPRAAVWLGDLYARAGRFQSGADVMSTFVRNSPDVAPGRYILGENLLGLRRYEAAIEEYQAASRLAPDMVVARYKLGVAYSRSGRPRAALREFAAVAKPMAQTSEYHLEAGLASLAAGDLEAALRSAQTVLELSPGDAAAHTLLGDVYAQRGDFSRALEMYGKSPNFGPARLGRGLVLTRQKKPEQAIAEYDAVLEADTTNADAVLAKVSALVQQQRLGEALTFLRERVSRESNNARYASALGRLYWINKEPGKAEQEFRRALAIDDGHTAARLNLAKIAVSQGRHRDAIPDLERVLKEQPSHQTAAVLLASIHARQGRLDDAVRILNTSLAVDEKAVPVGVSVYLAELLLDQGRYDDAIRRLAPVVTANPGLASARMMLGLARAGKRNFDQAVKEFEQARRLAPRLAINHYHLARVLQARGDIEAAKNSYRQALAIDSTLERARIALAALSGDTAHLGASGLSELETAVAKDPRNVSLGYALGRAYFVAKRMSEAEREFRRILTINASFAPANLGLALIRAQEGSAHEAADYLKAVVRSEPDHIQANLLLARYYDATRARALALRHFEVVHKRDPSLGETTLALARLYGEAGRLDEAVARASEFVAGHPNDARGPLALASLYHEKGDFERAVTEYRRLVALAPDNPVGYNNLAWLYAEREWNLDEALALARKAGGLAPDNPTVLDTMGWVHYARGEFADAESVLRKAARLAAGNARIHYHLGMACYRLGRRAEASAALRRALELDRNLTDASKIEEVLAELSG